MQYLLFTTTTCPKCPEIKEYVLSSCPISGQIVDNTSPDFGILASTFSVSIAPTFLVFDDNRSEVFRGNEVYEIESFFKK